MKSFDKFARKFSNVSLSYCDPALKDEFHREGKKVMKELAQVLELPANSFDIRSNMGGIAGSGEITLHAENLYVQLSERALARGSKMFLVRSCNGRKDYTGGFNNHVGLSQKEILLETCQRILDKAL